jgi:hypothetical protein
MKAWQYLPWDEGAMKLFSLFREVLHDNAIYLLRIIPEICDQRGYHLLYSLRTEGRVIETKRQKPARFFDVIQSPHYSQLRAWQ